MSHRVGDNRTFREFSRVIFFPNFSTKNSFVLDLSVFVCTRSYLFLTEFFSVIFFSNVPNKN